MKRFLLPIFFAATLPLLAGAQSQAHRAVDEALGNLRGSNNLWLRLDANDTVGSDTRQRTIHTFWSRSFNAQGRMVAKVELRDFDRGVLATRLVGDGMTFWRYDARANTYSAKRYGSYEVAMPPTYLQDLLQAFTASTEGHGTYLARLLKETFNSNGSRFSGWMPADLAPTLLTIGSRADPVLAARTYTAAPDREFAMFFAQLPGTARSLVFEIEKSSGRKLQAIYYAESDAVGNRARLREWTAAVTPFLPAGADFIFTIPVGAGAIAHRGG